MNVEDMLDGMDHDRVEPLLTADVAEPGSGSPRNSPAESRRPFYDGSTDR